MPLRRKLKQGVVVIAASTGGPKSLVRLFECLPKGFPAPIVVVQHLPNDSAVKLASRLNSIGTVPCAEARDGEFVTPGRAVIAPAGQHIRIDSKGRIQLEPGDYDDLCPSATVLFQSAAESLGAACIGVVLSGMGDDGAEGCAAIRRAGGVVYGESEKTCSYYGMPRAALEAGGIDAMYPIGSIAKVLFERVCAPKAVVGKAA